MDIKVAKWLRKFRFDKFIKKGYNKNYLETGYKGWWW